MASRKLTQFLTTPSKVANALDWKKLSGSVLTLDITRNEIGLTLASHPCTDEELSAKLDSIKLSFKRKGKRKCLDPQVIERLNSVVHTHKVCGFVVNWPLQKEGRMGKSCGRVLHTLDSLLVDSETPILSNNRKFCLWDGSHVPLENDDAFGRCPIYGRPSTNEEPHSNRTIMLSTVALAPAFNAPAMRAPATRSAVTMFSEGDLGVLPPLGVYDPLGLIETRDMRRYEIMEIKHGRAAMLGFLHVIALKAGIVLPGDLSPSLGIKFSDVPTTCFGSLEAVPTFGWLQIMLFTCMQETGASPLAEAQTDDKEAGDIAIDSWVRYDDPETKTFKLNAERQNGRAAMLGITGCLVHELLGVDALYPTGGLGGAAPPAIF